VPRSIICVLTNLLSRYVCVPSTLSEGEHMPRKIYHSVARPCLHCCESHQSFLWRYGDFGVLQLQNPWIDWHKIWRGWLRRRYYPSRQNSQETLLLQRDRARHVSVEILQLQNISLENPIVVHYLRDSTFSRFDTVQYRTVTDTHTDRRTDTRRRHIPHLA